ncbi:hypothetical protein, partial [Enterobacter sp. 725m/11]
MNRDSVLSRQILTYMLLLTFMIIAIAVPVSYTHLTLPTT